MRSRCPLYVLGTSHTLQCGSAKCSFTQIAAFREELQRIFATYSIQCVAEEMDAEGLRRHNVASTIAQPLASSLSIDHHNIDLTNEERSRFSLSESACINLVEHVWKNDGGERIRGSFDRTRDEVRERCWVARILAKQKWPTLLICGADHSQNIAKLWRRFGLKVEVLHGGDYAP